MNIYLIRHGQTDYNEKWLMQGWTDIPLNALGISQAEKAAAYFKRQGIRFEKVYSSPLNRAVVTAMTVSGLSEDEIIKDERAKEIGLGTVEGENYLELPQKYKNLLEAPEKYEVPEGGESIPQVQARTGSLLRDLKKLETDDNEDTNILVATHGCAIRAFLSVIEQTPMVRFWRKGLRNCAIVRLSLKGGNYQIEEIIESEEQ